MKKQNILIRNKTLITIGIILLIWTLFWKFQNKYYSGPYFITVAFIYTISLYLFVLYAIITLILSIYKLYKKRKDENKKSKIRRSKRNY